MTAPAATTDALARLRQAFTDALELPADVDHQTLAYRETPSWDSVAHMQLVLAIETAFDIMLDTEDVLALSSFTVAGELLRKYGITL